MFLSQDILFQNWIEHVTFMPCLDSLVGYSTGEFHALQLIVLVVPGAVDYSLTSCMLIHILEI